MNLLVIVDFQNDYVIGSLGYPDAKNLEAPILRKIQSYLLNEDEVVFVLDTHAFDYLYTEEGRNLPIPHCIKGSEGHNLYGKAARIAKFASAVFEKGTYGCEALSEYIMDGNFSSVELCGPDLNTGVLSNAIIAKTAAPYAQIAVDAECCRCFDPELNEKTLDVMESMNIHVTGRKKKKVI